MGASDVCVTSDSMGTNADSASWLSSSASRCGAGTAGFRLCAIKPTAGQHSSYMLDQLPGTVTLIAASHKLWASMADGPMGLRWDVVWSFLFADRLD
jgi:hypothetical protein